MTGGARTGVIVRMLLGLVRIYRGAVSPLLPPLCRFDPSCSRYAEEAIRQYGAARGIRLAFLRILRCRPGGGSGYDPVPLPPTPTPTPTPTGPGTGDEPEAA